LAKWGHHHAAKGYFFNRSGGGILLSFIQLDPIAVAREYGIGETDLLNDHPFQMNLKAKVTPLSETGLPEYIQNNKRLADGNSLNNENQSRKRGR
jgi:hypothetical protein